MAWETALRLDVKELDILFSIRLARLAFFSGLSSLFDDDDLAVSGGEGALMSRLEMESRLPIDIGRVVWVEGGREGDLEGDFDVEVSRFMDRRLSDIEVRPSLMKSLNTVIDDLRSFFGTLEVDSLDRRLSWIVSLGASMPAF